MPMLIRRVLLRLWLFVTASAALGFMVYGPFMPVLEGALFPVTSKIVPIAPLQQDDGLTFRFAYVKYRGCIYQGLNAFSADDGRYVDFNLAAGQPPNVTRVPGPQVSQVWHLDAESLDGVVIEFVHSCNTPWGITITKVWP